MAAFGLSGTITVSRVGDVVTVSNAIEIGPDPGGDTGGPRLEIAAVPTTISTENDAFLLSLLDSRAAGSTATVQLTIDRYAVRGGIARHHSRVSRSAEIAAAPDADSFGAPFLIPDGEVSVLTIHAAGDRVTVIE